MDEYQRSTSIYTAPKSRLGRLLRLAARLMPTVTIDARGWIPDTIELALVEYVTRHAVRNSRPEDPEAPNEKA